MARGGQNKERGDAERKCIVTGEVQPKTGLIRFVVGPENQVVPDILGKLPGRGMYVTADRAALEEAKKGQFSRSAKQAVTVPDGLVEEVERQLASPCSCHRQNLHRPIRQKQIYRQAWYLICHRHHVPGTHRGNHQS